MADMTTIAIALLRNPLGLRGRDAEPDDREEEVHRSQDQDIKIEWDGH